MGTLITWTVSFPVGIRSAIHRGGVYDRTATFLSYVLISIPGFFFAYILIIFVVDWLQVPVIGMQTFGMREASAVHPLWTGSGTCCCPRCWGRPAGSPCSRATCAARCSRSRARTTSAPPAPKACPWEMVHYKHALRNALLPFVTMFGLMLPGLIGGSVIIESIFSWPGLGRMAYEAILARDYPVILTINFIAAVLVLVGTFVSDLLYVVVDPRIRL